MRDLDEKTKCIGVVLPQNPPLEQLLLEMDLEGWKTR